jgi:hypothetical protein
VIVLNPHGLEQQAHALAELCERALACAGT